MAGFKGKYWNTRVIRTHVVYHFESGYVSDEYMFSIHEVYYNKKDKPIAWTENPISVQFGNENWLNGILEQIEDARKRTVLELENIDGKCGHLVDNGKMLSDYDECEEKNNDNK